MQRVPRESRPLRRAPERRFRAALRVSVGRVRPDRQFDLRMEVLVHNTIRGAAGAAILNAELLKARDLLP